MSSVPREVSLLFAGTGAADHPWKKIGAPGIRGSACMLLNGHILLDAGVTAFTQLTRYGVKMDEITDLLVTHTHIDHFDPAAIGEILRHRSPGVPDLQIRCSPEGAALLAEKGLAGRGCRVISLEPEETFQLGEIRVTSLPSNHMIKERPAEKTMWYLFRMTGGNLLYALDGAWITTRAAEILRDVVLDWAVWDATVHQAGDWRSFEHNDLEMVRMIRQALLTRGTVTEKTIHILTHFARTLWPDEETAKGIVEASQMQMARDGMELRFPL